VVHEAVTSSWPAEYHVVWLAWLELEIVGVVGAVVSTVKLLKLVQAETSVASSARARHLYVVPSLRFPLGIAHGWRLPLETFARVVELATTGVPLEFN
jgi:hypothetical protein